MESVELEILESVFVQNDEMQTYINWMVADKKDPYLMQFYNTYLSGDIRDLYREIEQRIKFLLDTI
jgi:hypothetical protein